MKVKVKSIKFFFLTFVILVFTHFFSFKGINIQVYKGLEIILLLLFLWITITGSRYNIKMHFKNYVYLFILLPLISIIPAYISHNQDISLSIYMWRFELIWLLYFVLHRINISATDVIRSIIVLAVLYVTISIIQQLTYPSYWFYTRGDSVLTGKEIEIRSGFYRYMISGIDILIIAFFIIFQKFISKINLLNKTAILCYFFLIGIYIFMTRQVLFGVIINILLAFLLIKSFNKKIALFIGIIIVTLIVSMNVESLFGELITSAQDDTANDDYVRFQSYNFFLYDYWDGYGTILFGNGPEHQSSTYGKEIQKYKDFNGFYRNDIGIIGAINKNGVIYGITFLHLLFFIYFRHRRSLEIYQKQFLLYTTVLCIMIFPFSQTFATVVFVVFLYLIDQSIHTKKIKKIV
jgi:hypothetical protein